MSLKLSSGHKKEILLLAFVSSMLKVNSEYDVKDDVIKKDNKREVYDRNKLTQGLVIACTKRSVSIDQIEKVVSEIEDDLKDRRAHGHIDRDGPRLSGSF